MPLRVGCSAPISLTSCVWRHSAPTRKARTLRCQGGDPRTAHFLLVLLLYPRSLADAIVKIFGSAVSLGKEEIPFLQWEQLLVARLPFSVPKHRIEDGCGTCSSASFASRIPFQVCAMLGLTPCAQLDFCRKFFNALAPLTKLRHCRRQSSSPFCMHSDGGLG